MASARPPRQRAEEDHADDPSQHDDEEEDLDGVVGGGDARPAPDARTGDDLPQPQLEGQPGLEEGAQPTAVAVVEGRCGPLEGTGPERGQPRLHIRPDPGERADTEGDHGDTESTDPPVQAFELPRHHRPDHDQTHRDSEVDDLGERPPPESGDDTEADEVPIPGTAVQDAEGEQQRAQSTGHGDASGAALIDGLVHHGQRRRPGDRPGQRGEPAVSDQPQRDPPDEDGTECRQEDRSQPEGEATLSGDGEDGGDHVGLDTGVGLAPEEGREVAVQELMGHQSGDRLVGCDRAVEQPPGAEATARDQGQPEGDRGEGSNDRRGWPPCTSQRLVADPGPESWRVHDGLGSPHLPMHRQRCPDRRRHDSRA